MNLSSHAELLKCPCDQHIQMLVFARIAKVGVFQCKPVYILFICFCVTISSVLKRQNFLSHHDCREEAEVWDLIRK